MKKSLLLLPLVAMSLAGCEPPIEELGDLLDIEVASGLKQEYVQYTIVELDEISVTATFEKKTVTIEGSDLSFDPETLDTSTLGESEITITYLTESVVWTYTVVEYDEIDNISAPDFVTTYLANIEAKDVANKRNEFMDREQGYFVGDDNPFKFFPNIYAYDGDGIEMEVTAYHSVSVVEEKRGTEWVILTGAELDGVVTIDDFASTYDFSEEAIGNTYRLTVRPFGDEYAVNPKFSTSFEFNVADGYNVYKQDDLSHFNNVGTNWDAYRTSKGITPVAINGLFLHGDIEIERSKLPDSFFYMEGDSDINSGDGDYERALGSLRDNVDIYHHDVAPGEAFVFNGNYFSIDYSTLPVVARESGRIDADVGLVISHATLIKAGYAQTGEDLGDYTMRNLRVIGNANRTEAGAKSGGAIFTKLLSVDSHLYNLIGTQCFTFILTELSGPNAIIEKTRGYDSFSSMLYNWGTDNLQIIDSEFIGAGGPIVIADHVGPEEDGTGGNPSHTTFTNTVAESIVTGNENWFRLVHADAALPEIYNVGELLLPNYGTNSITKLININGTDVPHFNLIGVVKDGGASEPSSTKISGSMTIDDGAALDFNGTFMTNSAPYPPAMPRFESSDGQQALFDGEKLVGLDNNPITPYVYSQTNYFTGPYLNMYVSIGASPTDYTAGYMGLVFGLQER
jgi:hypothetical protein